MESENISMNEGRFTRPQQPVNEDLGLPEVIAAQLPLCMQWSRPGLSRLPRMPSVSWYGPSANEFRCKSKQSLFVFWHTCHIMAHPVRLRRNFACTKYYFHDITTCLFWGVFISEFNPPSSHSNVKSVHSLCVKQVVDAVRASNPCRGYSNFLFAVLPKCFPN